MPEGDGMLKQKGQVRLVFLRLRKEDLDIIRLFCSRVQQKPRVGLARSGPSGFNG